MTLTQIQTLNDLLTILYPGETISPRYLARKIKSNNKIITPILMELSFRSLLDVRFIIQCDNEDPDLIHSFEFEKDDNLASFIRKTHGICPECNAELITSNIRVAFVRKEFEYQGELHG